MLLKVPETQQWATQKNVCHFEAHMQVLVFVSTGKARASSSVNDSITSVPQKWMMQLKEYSQKKKKVKFESHTGLK